MHFIPDLLHVSPLKANTNLACLRSGVYYIYERRTGPHGSLLHKRSALSHIFEHLSAGLRYELASLRLRRLGVDNLSVLPQTIKTLALSLSPEMNPSQNDGAQLKCGGNSKRHLIT